MTAAIARLDATLADLIAVHGGVRPVEQGEGDSFVLAFARASDAVACALDIAAGPAGADRLRIGLHTGEIQLRDEGNYIGPTINRTARLRDLGAWWPDRAVGCDRGDRRRSSASRRVADRPRFATRCGVCRGRSGWCSCATLISATSSRRCVTSKCCCAASSGAVDQFHRAVRRRSSRCVGIIADNRLVTLTGAGGSGKTRLAIQAASEFGDEVRYVDLAPIDGSRSGAGRGGSRVGPARPARSLDDGHDRAVRRASADCLLVLDNCEHLLDACAGLILAVLDACPDVTMLTTSREPIGVAGEVTWRVPSLSLADEAMELVHRSRPIGAPRLRRD